MVYLDVVVGVLAPVDQLVEARPVLGQQELTDLCQQRVL